jgi:hypothetical protein
MVYVPDGAHVEIDVSAVGSGPLSVTRFDPTDATSVTVDLPAGDTIVRLDDGATNANGDRDWVFVVNAA